MTRAIVWKEIREQGLIALMLVILGSVVLVAASMLADPPVETAPSSDVLRFLGVGMVATLMLTVTAGMVCGGAVFSAERESGTMSFLESLPTSHWRIWKAKLAAGLGLTIVQIAVLVTVAACLGLVTKSGSALAIFVYSLLAFVWGMFGSTLARTTLGSVGIAIPAAILTSFVTLIPITLIFQNPGSTFPRLTGVLLFLTCMLVVPLVMSSWLYTQPDRARRAEHGRPSRLGLASLHWLALRQLALPGTVISFFAIGLGLCMLAPGIEPFMVWPGLALIAGVVSGVLAFADEQHHGSGRFWSEQRLPLGRLWSVKVGLSMAFCAWLLVLLALPMELRHQFSRAEPWWSSRGHTAFASMFNCPLFDELGHNGWKYLLLPAVYGFTAGHLCSLVFRKLVVACGVAGLLAGAGTLAWGPSLLSGGVKQWQLWLPPLITLATGRLLLRSWSADRLASRQSLTALATGVGCCLLALAVGIGFRVLEVPDRPDSEADVHYVTSLVSVADNLAARDLKTATERYSRNATANSLQFDQNRGRRKRIEDRLDEIPARGWPENDSSLDEWLEHMYAPASPGEDGTWYSLVEASADRPVGIYEHPLMIPSTGVTPHSLLSAQRMGTAMLARGLQLQARGKPEAFVTCFRGAMTLARSLQNGSVISCLRTGFEVERQALLALDRWLEHLPPEAEGIRAVLAPVPASPTAALGAVFQRPRLLLDLSEFLTRIEPAAPFDPAPNYLAERFVMREAMKSPNQWLATLMTPPGATSTTAEQAVNLVGIAWAVPWERERTRRLLGLDYEKGQSPHLHYLAGRPGSALLMFRTMTPRDLIEFAMQLTVARRAAILSLALRAFHAEHGKYPDALQELVQAGCLHELPRDPHDESRNYGYRVSRGEVLRATIRGTADRLMALREEPVDRAVAPGQAILWSVGQDRVDQGGMNPPGVVLIGHNRSDDVVILVPPGPIP